MKNKILTGTINKNLRFVRQNKLMVCTFSNVLILSCIFTPEVLLSFLDIVWQCVFSLDFPEYTTTMSLFSSLSLVDFRICLNLVISFFPGSPLLPFPVSKRLLQGWDRFQCALIMNTTLLLFHLVIPHLLLLLLIIYYYYYWKPFKMTFK